VDNLFKSVDIMLTKVLLVNRIHRGVFTNVDNWHFINIFIKKGLDFNVLICYNRYDK